MSDNLTVHPVANYWFEQSLLHYFDHCMSAHMLWGAVNDMGVTSGECVRIARDHTVAHFNINVANVSEQQINDSIDNYLMG
jgi:hypothetical protein